MEQAGFWLRMIACLIDSILILSVGFILYFIFGVVSWAIVASSSQTGEVNTYLIGLFVLYVLLLLVTAWLYFAGMESSPRQGTLGKLVVGLHVGDLYGRRISFWRASGRFFAKFISGFLLLVGFLMAGWTRKKQTLHDLCAGTTVFRGPVMPVLLMLQMREERPLALPRMREERV
jgi:uncharacterized RDD family membrane protein YckC